MIRSSALTGCRREGLGIDLDKTRIHGGGGEPLSRQPLAGGADLLAAGNVVVESNVSVTTVPAPVASAMTHVLLLSIPEAAVA